MSVRDDILKKINKKADRYREQRAISMGKGDYDKLLVEIIKNIDEMRSKSTNGVDFAAYMDTAYEHLKMKLRRSDPNVIAELIWNHEDMVEEWQDLRIVGIRIVWSDKWKLEHPNEDGERYLSVDQIWLEGL